MEKNSPFYIKIKAAATDHINDTLFDEFIKKIYDYEKPSNTNAKNIALIYHYFYAEAHAKAAFDNRHIVK